VAADPNDPRTKRRKAMGDDPNKMAMSPQALPGAPQANNVMNYPMTDTNGQMGQSMGQGGTQFPYGDTKIDGDVALKMGSVGFTGNSGMPQYIVPGRRMNTTAYNTQPQPGEQQMSMMEPGYDAASALGKTMPNGLNNNKPVSYDISAMGPAGKPGPIAGAIPSQLSYQGPTSLPMSGGQGMSTGRGGGRNKSK
jgi:hypothetical protein